jgi:CheY-like chemotaxis protein
LVEDESLVAMMMGEALRELGYSVVGPCVTTAEAAATIDSTDVNAAILDVNLDGELVYPVAELLAAREIPFAFITGYGEDSLSPRYANVPVLQKPIDRNALRELFRAAAIRDSIAARSPLVSRNHLRRERRRSMQRFASATASSF